MFSPLSAIRRFARTESGSVIAEVVIVIPILIWAFLALFVYWDAYRSMNTVQKASYTISDTISREQESKPSSYFDGLREVMDYMLDADQDVKMRVTSITYDDVESRFEVLWSYSPNGDLPELTTEDLAVDAVKDRIPDMANADFATIVETEVPYEPAFDVGMNDTVQRQFIVTRPRFVSPNCMDGRPCTGT